MTLRLESQRRLVDAIGNYETLTEAATAARVWPYLHYEWVKLDPVYQEMVRRMVWLRKFKKTGRVRDGGEDRRVVLRWFRDDKEFLSACNAIRRDLGLKLISVGKVVPCQRVADAKGDRRSGAGDLSGDVWFVAALDLPKEFSIRSQWPEAVEEMLRMERRRICRGEMHSDKRKRTDA